MARRRYSAAYRKMSKRDRASYRRAVLRGHDEGVRWWASHERKSKRGRHAMFIRVRDAQNAARKRHWRRIPCKKRAWVGKKIRILIHEGYPQKQAIAIAMRMAGVPRKRRHGRGRR